MAVSKRTSCLRRFCRFFCSSHSNRIAGSNQTRIWVLLARVNTFVRTTYFDASPLETVQNALLPAAARRLVRPPDASPLIFLNGPTFLTVTDHASRFLLTCEALSSTGEDYAFTVFERLFKERGLPANIRSDNGVPFASAHALFNLSKLAVWWLRLGMGIERIKPGHPNQNGRHERMHLTLKKEATKPAAGNFLQQQARFDKFIEIFNNERPHEAPDMKCPRGGLPTFPARLHRTARHRLPLLRQDHCGHQLRAHLPGTQEDCGLTQCSSDKRQP
jgi:transposase InsO family protein